MKNFLRLIFLFILILANSFNYYNAAELSSKNNVVINKDVKIQLNKIKTKRIIIANALLLTDAQKTKANSIYANIYEKETLLISQLEQEATILKLMSKDKKNSANRKKQRTIVFELQTALKNVEAESEKEFKKILTHEQRVKFKKLRKEISIADF